MREKDCPDRLSVSEVYIDRNNQNMIGIIEVQPNIDDILLSREYNCAHLDDVNEKRILSRSRRF
jgi:hypothetical protein